MGLSGDSEAVWPEGTWLWGKSFWPTPKKHPFLVALGGRVHQE